MVKIDIPNEVNYIIEKLNDNGYEAYVVGGCVRDCILGTTPNDWDITTSAIPKQVKDIFERTIDTGLKHGTVTVLLKESQYEVTTYRIDGEYLDNRRPKEVKYTSNLIEDLKRRDFTINAMAYNNKDGLIDAFSGISDINNKIIRCVGNPNERFNEDALRMLRAVRFSAQLGFKIDVPTRKSIKYNAHLIKKISAERIHIELTKTLISDNPNYIKKLVRLGLMERIIPEFMGNISLKQNNPYHAYNVDEHIYLALKNIEATETLRWTMFLHDIGKAKTKTIDSDGIGHFIGHVDESIELGRNILNRLKFDNNTKNKILHLIKFHDYRLENNKKCIRRAVNKISDDLFLDYIKVQKADIKAQNPKLVKERIEKLDDIVGKYNELKLSNECTSLKDLKINGKDLIMMGLGEGKQIGKILNTLLEYVLDEPNNNNRDWLLKKAQELQE